MVLASRPCGPTAVSATPALLAKPTGRSQAVTRPARHITTRVSSKDASQQLDSLVAQSLAELAADPEQQEQLSRLKEKGQAALTKEERLARQRSLETLNVPSFQRMLAEKGVTPLTRNAASVLQLNIGLYCNQACSHCHVESSPLRKEMMDRKTAARCMELLAASPEIGTVDITGGAPELNSEFRYIVQEARAMGKEVLDRCNLTVLLEPGQEDLVDFLAGNKVHVVASLPCYSEANVDGQRGRGVFDRSILGLQRLNAAGFGVEESGLLLDLVYNPGGAFLAPSQAALEPAYKQELKEPESIELQAYGITFNNLLALNNMPIKRFHDFLSRAGKLEEYMGQLVENFNPAAAEGIMCRDIISVGWNGRLYDCDFNQQLEMSMVIQGATNPTVFDIERLSDLEKLPIACDNHCYGCTAGSGSSCSGSTDGS